MKTGRMELEVKDFEKVINLGSKLTGVCLDTTTFAMPCDNQYNDLHNHNSCI